MPWNSCSFISLFQYKYNSNYSNEINNQLYHFRQITNGKVYKKLANRMSKNDPFNFYLFGKMRICFSSKCMPKIHTQNCLSFVIVVSYAESERARARLYVCVSRLVDSPIVYCCWCQADLLCFYGNTFPNLVETHAWQIVISQTFTCKRYSFDWQSNSSSNSFFLRSYMPAWTLPLLSTPSNQQNRRNGVKFMCWLIKSNQLLWLDVMPFIYYYYLTVHKNSLNLILKKT